MTDKTKSNEFPQAVLLLRLQSAADYGMPDFSLYLNGNVVTHACLATKPDDIDSTYTPLLTGVDVGDLTDFGRGLANSLVVLFEEGYVSEAELTEYADWVAKTYDMTVDEVDLLKVWDWLAMVTEEDFEAEADDGQLSLWDPRGESPVADKLAEVGSSVQVVEAPNVKLFLPPARLEPATQPEPTVESHPTRDRPVSPPAQPKDPRPNLFVVPDAPTAPTTSRPAMKPPSFWQEFLMLWETFFRY